jgi:hypothetical protein
MTPDAATSSPAAEREWYRMRTADTEKGSSYSSNDSERINSPGLPAGTTDEWCHRTL